MPNKTIHNILLIDSATTNRELIESVFQRAGLSTVITQIDSTIDILKGLKDEDWQTIILAIDDIPISVPQLLTQIPDRNINTPIIVLVDNYDRERALELLSDGIYDVIAIEEIDYLTHAFLKGIKTEELTQTLKLQREAIKAAHDRFRVLTAQLPVAIAFIHEGAIINANPEFQDLFHLDSPNAIAEVSFLDLIDSNDITKVKHVLTEFNNQEDINHQKLENVKLKNSSDSETSADLLFTRSTINQESGLQIIINCQPEPVREKVVVEPTTEEELPHKLLSPEFFIQILNQTIRNQNKEKSFSLCFLEIDDYIKYKKRMGITRSDFLFHTISDYISSFVTENIQISQLNVDVYTLLISADSTSACEEVTQNFINSIQQNVFLIDDQKIKISTNSGLVHLNNTIKNHDQALSLADVACTVSRNKNMHSMHVYSQEEDRSTVESVDFSWSGRIEDALKNDNFKLVYQPILQLKDDPSPLYEVLIRMKSSHGSDIMPGQFLHAASRSSLEEKIDKWVVTHTLNTLKGALEIGTCFFINLSATSFKSMAFIDWLKSVCKEYSHQLVFEITEHLALEYESEVLHFIQEMKKTGCQICIDHFGNHPDAIEELATMGADYYKIDGAFINHLATNRKHQSIIHNIVRSTAKNNVKTIACFVQDADSLAILWKEGVDYIQGNYLQTPNSQLSYKFSAQI